MPQYLSGADLLADARMRLDVLPKTAAILILEGRDDFLVFCRRCVALDAIVVAGNKMRVLDAHSRLRGDELDRFVCLVDCDYDVPAGRLSPGPNLIVTRYTDMEVDLAELGIARAIALRSIPESRESDAKADMIAARLLEQAVGLADALGRARYLSSVEDLHLRFVGIELRKFRDRSLGGPDIERLAHAIVQRSPGTGVAAAELLQRIEETPGGLRVCNGKDLAQAFAAVVHQDYGVSLSDLNYIYEVFTNVDKDVFDQWSVVERIRRWEAQHGRRIFV